MSKALGRAFDDAYLPPDIEGCTKEDAGWEKASEGILVGRYVRLCNPNFWYIDYSHPPCRAILVKLQSLQELQNAQFRTCCRWASFSASNIGLIGVSIIARLALQVTRIVPWNKS